MTCSLGRLLFGIEVTEISVFLSVIMAVMLTVIMIMVTMFLLLFILLVVGVATWATKLATSSAELATSTAAEIVHIVLIPVLSKWLSLIFLVLIDPLSPVGLDVCVLHLFFG